MTTITGIAQRILDENAYALEEFSGLTLTILEYKIDECIDYVNLMAGTSIAALSGSAGAKDFVYSVGENIPVKQLANLMLKALQEKGDSAGLGVANISYLQANPDYAVGLELVKTSIDKLKENVDVAADPPIYVYNDPIE